jgi:hypothetical protein
MDAESGADQLLERGNGEPRRAAKDEIQRHLCNWVIL